MFTQGLALQRTKRGGVPLFGRTGARPPQRTTPGLSLARGLGLRALRAGVRVQKMSGVSRQEGDARLLLFYFSLAREIVLY